MMKEAFRMNEDPGIKPGCNYDAWRTPRLQPREFEKLSLKARLRYLALCAHLAPSSHNTQSWAFRLLPEISSVEVYLDRGEYFVEDNQVIDRRLVLPASDVVGRQSCISVGCAITNLTVAVEYFGYQPTVSFAEIDPAEVRPLEDPKNLSARRYTPIATVGFLQAPIQEIGDRGLFEAIFTRRVDRGRYDPHQPISEETLETVKDLGNNMGVDTLLFTDRVRREAIAQLQGFADNFVANHPVFARELGDWFIENDSESGVGMPGDTFLQANEDTIEIRRALLGEAPLQAKHIAGFVRSGMMGIRTAYVVGMLTVEQDTPEFWVKAGMVLEKGALIFEKNGIRWTTHAGLTEVDQVNLLMLRPLGFTGKKPVILFRAGYPHPQEEIKPHTPRRPLDQVLLP